VNLLFSTNFMLRKRPVFCLGINVVIRSTSSVLLR